VILNRQRGVRVSVRDLERFLARAQRALRIRSDALAICLVTDGQMARWNRAFRGKKGPTDVLSFPASKSNRNGRVRAPGKMRNRGRGDGFRFGSFASSASSAWYLGDIAIAPSVARENARRFGRTTEDELRALILHGLLHLMGYDHETDKGQMQRREQRLRGALGLA
jgi:probable rRNA maturation factor